MVLDRWRPVGQRATNRPRGRRRRVRVVVLCDDEELAAPLRVALGRLAPVCTLLANPGTPMPEALRESATGMLRSLLRREMIEDGGE